MSGLPALALQLLQDACELTQLDTQRAQQPHHRMPPHAAVTVLELGEVGHPDLRALPELRLGQPRTPAQDLQRPPQLTVIALRELGRRVTDHCNLSKDTLRSDASKKWRPRCDNTRAPGTGSCHSRHAGHATNRWRCAPMPERQLRSPRPGGTG